MPSTEAFQPIHPIAPWGTAEQVTDGQLARFAELIYRRAGIRVSPQKKTLLSNRLRRRLRETGIKDFEHYYQHLAKLRPDDPEWDAFLQEITTHETYLFRDEAQWRWFCREFLAEVSGKAALASGSDEAASPQRPKSTPQLTFLKKPPAGFAPGRTGNRFRSLRIWSAACSTGDEAITAACCVAAHLPNLAQWDVRILGTDIGVGAIEQAQSGVFGERAMHLVPPHYRQQFFTKAKDANVWQARPILMNLVSFRQHNLLDPLHEPPFDLVFLKNVLIYFDTASKKTVVENVRRVIRPGGYLVAGAAEGVSDLVKDYVRLQPWLFRRPPDPDA